MKTLIFAALAVIFLLSVIIFSLDNNSKSLSTNSAFGEKTKCSSLSTSQTSVTVLPNGDSLLLPLLYRHRQIQGDDSFVGLITSDCENLVIHYDIGGSSGEYVQEKTPGAVIERAVNEEFIYVIEESEGSEVKHSFTLLATFPNRGPANFYGFISSKDDPRIKTIIQLLKTYDTKSAWQR